MKIKVKQNLNAPAEKAVDSIDALIVVLPCSDAKPAWPVFAYRNIIKKRFERLGDRAGTTEPFVTELPNGTGTRVACIWLAADSSAFQRLTLARKAVAALLGADPANIDVLFAGLESADTEHAAQALVAALLAASAELPQFKSKQPKPKRLATVALHGVSKQIDLARTLAEAAGNNLARELTILPSNELTPAMYRKRIATLARQHGWRMQFLDTAALKRKKAGAFLAVAQGSAEADAGIVHLQYRPRHAKRKLALVGKGICYDTGGVNVKPAKFMYGMHEDMAGSAVALGTLLALTGIKADIAVDCWLALAQNHVGPKAYKPNDIVTASNGTTIEVVHTDAEGRMVLADTLAIASQAKPDLIIDYATLTGSCVHALGTAYSGAFTNRDEMLVDVIAAGRDSGERVWPFPTDADYDKALDSDIADIKQCALDGTADHILATRFLSRFVGNDIPWLHIDLSASSNKGGLAHVPTDTTGFGIRYTLNLLLDKQVIKPARAIKKTAEHQARKKA
ncbi:MAG: leucyl aminopeptidase [Gammaproteobacteria bacterium]|nr:MAG: leucyl aminopeptidase [Gammaproteobacteria bacterium]TND04478.1 MAG: leucyl aminopeptidase [Gammaproteobacteria bacterium]